MKIISHRGILAGKGYLDGENSPKQITQVIEEGYDVEIDLRVIGEKLYLGHDVPQYEIVLEFLHRYKDKLWVHCKNIEAFDFCLYRDLNFFSHDNDKWTKTSTDVLWTGDLEIAIKTQYPVIFLSPELYGKTFTKLDKNVLNMFQGICTDYPLEYEQYLYKE